MSGIIAFFARRNLLANVITLMVVLLGIGALTIIQRDNFPSVDFNEMVVTTRYSGASPQDVELNVTNAIEEELEEVDGLKKVVSFSMENISVVHITLDSDLKDTDKTKTDVRDAVARVSDLPREVDSRPSIVEITTSTGIPIIEVGLGGKVPYAELRELAKRSEKALLNVPGVSRVDKFGYLDREIKVELSRQALKRYRITAGDVVAAIQNRNIRSTGGSFESYTSEKNIVTLAQFQNSEEVNEVIVRSEPGGAVIRVKDVASVRSGFEEAKALSRLNGTSSISFLVFKKSSADIIRTVDAIKALVKKNRHRFPETVTIDYSNDTSRIVRNRLQVAMSNGLIGLVLVLVVLSLFLSLRSAFWVAMGIPVALLGTLFLLPVFDAYLDSIALAAMILVIGIIVDDGIVIAESIWLFRERGYTPLDAAIHGTAVVFKPVVTTIITTTLAFAPMFFMSGLMGSFVYVIPLVVILALAISLIEITTALPAHLIAGAKPDTKVRALEPGQWFFGLRKGFGKFLDRVLQLRYPVIAVFATCLITAFWY
ncbi:MAG: efflux RND transporter permease subunit, partial [Gammaproteobacteria bacterium]|nr:efflux RND transporter permease subunit [Gammaproteobacteria bacterium]